MVVLLFAIVLKTAGPVSAPLRRMDQSGIIHTDSLAKRKDQFAKRLFPYLHFLIRFRCGFLVLYKDGYQLSVSADVDLLR